MPENRVSLLVKDTEGSPDKAVAALTELSSKDIVAAIGPLLTKEAEALVPVPRKAEGPRDHTGGVRRGYRKLSPWLFRNALTNSIQAAAAAQFALGPEGRKSSWSSIPTMPMART